MSTLLGTAFQMHAAGVAVIPLATDGTKRSAVDWKAYQDEAPGSVQLRRWFARPADQGGYDGLGVPTRPVSGNLELFELEGRAVLDGTWGRFEQAARDHGLGELLDRLKAGWLELSPAGGLHLLYRVDCEPDAMRGNTKLARRPGTTPGTVDVLIETRGRGGFYVTAPSDGRSHPSGKPWAVVAGGGSVRTITVEERDALYLLAGTFDEMPVTHLHQLEAQPYQLNTPTGVVDLRTGAHPVVRRRRRTTVGAVPRRHLRRRPDLSTYLPRILGQALFGQVLAQILPFAYGAGANGKLTLLGVVQRLIGIGEQGYSISAGGAPATTANPGHPTEIARLAGARLVVTSELEDGQRFAEAKVKMLTGRDTISGRFMRQDWFSFSPTHTLFLLANHQPEVRAGGEAFWRRIALLPFLYTVPKDLRNPHLEEELVEQARPRRPRADQRQPRRHHRDGVAALRRRGHGLRSHQPHHHGRRSHRRPQLHAVRRRALTRPSRSEEAGYASSSSSLYTVGRVTPTASAICLIGISAA